MVAETVNLECYWAQSSPFTILMSAKEFMKSFYLKRKLLKLM